MLSLVWPLFIIISKHGCYNFWKDFNRNYNYYYNHHHGVILYTHTHTRSVYMYTHRIVYISSYVYTCIWCMDWTSVHYVIHVYVCVCVSIHHTHVYMCVLCMYRSPVFLLFLTVILPFIRVHFPSAFLFPLPFFIFL